MKPHALHLVAQEAAKAHTYGSLTTLWASHSKGYPYSLPSLIFSIVPSGSRTYIAALTRATTMVLDILVVKLMSSIWTQPTSHNRHVLVTLQLDPFYAKDLLSPNKLTYSKF